MAEDKLNYWKTPEGRARASKLAKERARKRKREKLNGSNSKEAEAGPQHALPETTVAYALGHCEAWLQAYAGSAGVSSKSLTFRVGELLRAKARG
jgi:hypothetical protein